MALPTNTQTTYDTKGNREDLSDVIYNISPQDTPFFTMAGSTKATSTKHEWQTDALDAPTDNAALEGDDASAVKAKATTRLSNNTQIFTKSGVVSGTQRAMNPAGRADEYAYQMEKRTKEIKKDIELALVGNQTPSAGTSTTARKLRSLTSWIGTNYSAGTGFAVGTETAAATKGTARDFTESMLKDVIQKCYTEGGNPTKIMVAPSKKVLLTSTTGMGTNIHINREPTSKTGGMTVDVYQSDFGMLDVIPNRVMSYGGNDDKMFVIDPEYWSVATLRNFEKHDLAKTGDSDKFQIIAELTLEARNEASSGAVFDLK